MNKNRGRFIAFWLVAVLLAGFYLTMLICGKMPDVGIEYRMYYLTHELSDWPGYGNLSYELGTEEICTSLKTKDNKDFTGGKVCQRKGQGFLPKQYEGSESTGEASYIYYIPTEGADTAVFQFEINGFTEGGNGNGSVKVYVEKKITEESQSIESSKVTEEAQGTESSKVTEESQSIDGFQEIGIFNGEGSYSMDIGSIAKDELLTIKFVTDNCSFRIWKCSVNK